VNLHLVEMEEDGFIEDAIEKDLELSANINCDADTSNKAGSSEGDDSSFRLSLQDMVGLFIIFYAVNGDYYFHGSFCQMEWQAEAESKQVSR